MKKSTVLSAIKEEREKIYFAGVAMYFAGVFSLDSFAVWYAGMFVMNAGFFIRYYGNPISEIAYSNQ